MIFLRRGILAVLGLLILIPAVTYARGSGQEVVLAHRHTVYWAPGNAQGKQPLILFSHGFKGCSLQTTFLMEALAADGYWVFAPDHDDASCGAGRGNLLKGPQHEFGQPEEWSDQTYTDRADDMRDVVDALQHDPQFRDRIDFSRIGLAGHSIRLAAIPRLALAVHGKAGK